MDVLTAAIIACSLHPDESLVRALVQGQSEGAQFFVGDLTDLRGASSARHKEEAAALLLAVERKGHRAALGLLGLPSDWAESYGRQKADLWDACVNVSVGTAKLSEFDYECRKPVKRRPSGATGPSNRACIVRHFAAALELPAKQRALFVSGILTNVRDMTNRRTPFRPPPSTARDVTPTTAEWSPDLFFSGATREPPALPPFSGAAEHGRQ